MVNEVLQEYMRALHRRLAHLPGRLRRRVVSEIVAHVVLESADLQRKDPLLQPGDATRQVIEAFCPPEEVLVAYGPEGGVVRRSTGTVVLRSRVLTVPVGTTRRTVLLNGAAAAGFVAALAILGVLAFSFVPTAEDGAVQSLDWPSLTGEGRGLTGEETRAWTLPSASQITLSVDAAGCLGLRITAEDGAVVLDALDDCLDGGVWTAPEGGLYMVESRYTDWTGNWTLQAGPLP